MTAAPKSQATTPKIRGFRSTGTGITTAASEGRESALESGFETDGWQHAQSCPSVSARGPQK